MIASQTIMGHDLNGRDIANMGNIIIVDGILSFEEGELYLTTYDNIKYNVHLGPEFYSNEIGFKRDNMHGQSATVKGFYYEFDISAIQIDVGDMSYLFRTEDGLPLWRGRGGGQNRVESEDDC